MKLLTLDLIAVGPFTNLSLDFSAGRHGVHVVYGPNEAGKSSALRALQALLYGFHPQTADNFLHSYDKLRVGGELNTSDGTTLACVRKKGNKGTLLDAAGDEPIDEHLLARMLDGVDKDQFRQRFGIDHEELRSGCQSLVAGKGDLAEALFSAGAGLGDVHRVLATVRNEAEEIYKPRGKNQKLPEAKNCWRQAVAELTECQQSAPVWKQRQDELNRHRQQRETLEQEIAQLSAEFRRVERIQMALEPIAKRNHLMVELKQLGDVPSLSPDFDQRRIAAVTELAAVHSQQKGLREAIARLEGELAACPSAGVELDYEAEIKSLVGECHTFQRDDIDRANLANELAQLDQQTRHLLRELGHGDMPFDDAARLHIDKLRRERIRKLTAEQMRAEHERGATDDELKEVAAELQRLEADADAADPPSTEALAALIREVRADGDLDRQLDEATVAVRDSRRELEGRLKRLSLWDGTAEALAATKVPSRETVRRFEQALEAAEAEYRSVTERANEAADQLETLAGQIAELDHRHDVPTETELTTARESRERSWQAIRGRWLNEPGGDDADLPRGDAELARQFETESASADQVSDRLRREAEHVAAKADRMAQREKLLTRQARLAERQAAAEAKLNQVRSDWIESWREAAIEPLPPREMADWLDARDELLSITEELSRQSDTVARLESRIGSYCERLRAQCDAVHCPIPAATASLTTILREADKVVERIEQQRRAQQAAIENRNRTQREHEKLSAKRERLRDEAQQAADAWREEFSGFDLPAAVSAEEADGLLNTLDDFFRVRGDADSLATRIAGIDARGEAFQAQARSLAEAIDGELAVRPAAEIARELEQRLTAAHKAAEHEASVEQQLDDRRQELETVNRQAASLEETLARMCREAKCEQVDQLGEIAERSRTQRETQNELNQIETTLAGIAQGTPLAEFLAVAQQEDADRIAAEAERLENERQQKQSERDELIRQITSVEEQLRAAASGDRAVVAAENVRAELAQIATHAEKYARLKLAESVLSLAMQRYQEQHQGPILGRASEYFATLTQGSFDRLKSDWGEGDHPILVGVRAGSDLPVRIHEMSDGSKDQLYLALRLAALEHHFQRREPLPLVVDDILIHFDDDRSAAALRALAKISHTTQVILFTHHRHLVDLAGQTLDEETLFVQELTGSVEPSRGQRSLLA